MIKQPPRKLLVLAVMLAAVLSTMGGVAAAEPGDGELARLRHATAQFRDLEVAQDAGYGLLVDAAGIACIEQPGLGAMGIHYVSGALVSDAVVDAARPEAVIYEPTASGRMRLVGLEYVVFQAAWDAENAAPPELFGQPFKLVEAGNRYGLPAFYELHAWVWQRNPSGTFSDYNPRVSCEHTPF